MDEKRQKLKINNEILRKATKFCKANKIKLKNFIEEAIIEKIEYEILKKTENYFFEGSAETEDYTDLNNINLKHRRH